MCDRLIHSLIIHHVVDVALGSGIVPSEGVWGAPGRVGHPTHHLGVSPACLPDTQLKAGTL